MAKSKTYIYPRTAPNTSSRADGLGSAFNTGAEFPTDSIDYIKFTEFEVDYSGGGGLASTGSKVKQSNLDSTYLYIPQNLSTAYGANYNPVALGVLGVEAAKALGSTSATEIAASLQNAAQSATPEALFGTIASGINAANGIIGISGSASANSISAVGQGLVFNPFQEQVFEGVSFREHNFSFKLIARNTTEANDIIGIVKFFKKGMLPSYDSGPSSGAGALGGGQGAQAANSPGSGTTGSARYLKVPNRFMIEFKRLNDINSSANNNGIRVSSSSIAEIPGLYKFKPCVLTSVNVSYTPDGQYVNTDAGAVPALTLDLRFAEISIVTREDIDQGY
jgi:hypothetical protein